MRGKDGNLLLVGNYAPGTGYAWWLMQRYWLEIADLANRMGLSTYLAYPEEGPLPTAITRSTIEVLWRSFDTTDAGGIARAVGLLRRLRIRNIYLTDRAFFSPAYLAFRAAGVRRIINHDHTPGDRPRIDGLRGALKGLRNRLPAMRVDQWIALSPLMRTRAIENGRIPPDRVVVVPNGIDPIERWSGAAESVRSTFGLAPDARVVVTVGRAHPYKRIDFVLRLARRVTDSRPNAAVTFLYIGDGPDMHRLKSIAEGLELRSPRVVFAGHRADVRTILPGCDVALHPSQGEGFSLAILEYLSAGLPTLVPDIPSVAQIIEPDQTGFIYRDDDLGDAEQRLLWLLDHDEARERMGDSAAAFVKREHGLDHASSCLRSVVRQHLWTRDLGE
jgi:glycosyltransferase involved in cell wall biosynthesis